MLFSPEGRLNEHLGNLEIEGAAEKGSKGELDWGGLRTNCTTSPGCPGEGAEWAKPPSHH